MLKSPLIPKSVKIIDIFQETPDTFTLTLNIKMKHEPGQFVQISLLGVGEAPISISSFSRKYLKLTIRTIGKVTQAVHNLKKGDIIHLRGPYGTGYPLPEHESKNIILIGGGCGVAPLKGAIDYLNINRTKYKNIYLFLGYRSPQDIIYKHEMKAWSRDYELDYTVENAPNSSCYTGKTGYVTKAINDFSIGNPEDFLVLMCGPPIMLEAAIETLKQKGINYNQVYISAERMMYCGVGQCCHCMIHGKFVCTDGPVFCYEDIYNFKND